MNKPTPDAQLKRERPPFTIIEDAILLDKRIHKHGLLVYWVLCKHSDNEARCFPSIRKIAKEGRMSASTVWAAIEELIKNGYIEKQTRSIPGKKEKTSNLYTILYRRSHSDTPCSVGDIPCIGGRHTRVSPGDKELNLSELDPINQKEIAAQEAAVKLPAKIIHGKIRLLFEELHGKQYSNYGKEGKAIKSLITIVERLFPDKDPETAITFMARFLKHLKDTRREKYWREVTISPSALLARWDQVYDIARGNHAQATNWQNMEGVLA